MRRKEEEAVHLSIYRQPCRRGEGRQQLFADVKCQESDNEVKPLPRDLGIPHRAARCPSGCEKLLRELNDKKSTATQRTAIPSRNCRTGSLVHQQIQHIL